MEHKNRNIKRWLQVIIVLLSLVCIGYIVEVLYARYTMLYTANTEKEFVLHVPSGASLEEVLDTLRANGVLKNVTTFLPAAVEERCVDVRMGRYRIKSGMSNVQLVRMLKLGHQEPVNLVIAGHIRSNERLAAVLSRSVAPDSSAFVRLLLNPAVTREFGYTPETVIGMIIPNTYQVYWSTTAADLLQRLYKEYDRFWNNARMAKLKEVGLTRYEVITLASIVNEETNKSDEMSRVAGVYINRLHKQMLLQADPTLKYAVNDFSLRRVLNKHKLFDSPYNTYKYAGLPPGPVCVPSIASIDAVLNYEHHDYLYFCAKDDFSGYHVFAITLEQHNRNANAYHRALNNNGVR